LHIQLDKRNEKIKATEELFNARWREMEALCNLDYMKYVKAQQRLIAPSNRVSKEVSTQIAPGQSRVIDATVRVEQHLDAHPEDLNLSPRALALKLGVGKSTANNVQRMRKGQGGYTNGQGDVVQ